MASEHSLQRYRDWYARLLRLYSKPFQERFGEGMEQTFNDLLRERAVENKGLFGCAVWMYAETCGGIMRDNFRGILMQNKQALCILLVIAGLLMVPVVGMLISDEMNWGLGDFIVAGILLGGTGLVIEVAARLTPNNAYRAAVGIAVVTSLVLVWINLAVGLIGSEDNPANTMYFGVLLIGFAGAIFARFRPRGMARALFATALAQFLVPLIALAIFRPPMNSTEALFGILGVLILNSFFAVLFVGSGFLFQRAGETGGGLKPTA